MNLGWEEAGELEQAQLLIVNSCALTSDSIKALRKFLRASQRKFPHLKIAVVGCVSEIYPHELEGIPLDFCLGNREKGLLPGIVSGNRKASASKINFLQGHLRAFVKIQEGCNNACSYCCVRLARGSSWSRNPREVIAEIAGLVENGYQEIVLTGICLGDYGKEISYSLPRLLEELQNLDFSFRIRLSSIEPQDVTKDLVSALRNFKKVVPHLHIPLQSGSDRILALMKRRYDVSCFKKLILYLKQEVDNFQFSTDVMVGFPQETEADFVQTVEILDLLKPIKVHIFPFSPRPDTSAYQLEGRLPPKIIWERRKRLQELVDRIRKETLLSQIGKKLEVLFERRKNGYWLGYSENYILSALLEEGNLENKLIPVVAIGVMDSNLLLTRPH